MTGKDLDGVDELTEVLVEFYEKLSSWEHSVSRGKGLTLPQLHAIEILGLHGGLTMKELAEKTGVTTGSLTVLVDGLEGKGLVERQPHERDRRSIRVRLTEAGRLRSQDHHKLHRQLTQEIVAAFEPDETAQLAALLRKALDRF